MLIEDAQREVRTVFLGGFWGQLVSSIIWLASAGLATWVSPKAAIWSAMVGGFFIYPLTRLLLRLSGRHALLARDNSLNQLGMQICVCRCDPASASRAGYRIATDLVFSVTDGNYGGALPSVCVSIWDADFHAAGRAAGRVRGGACILRAWILQSGRVDRRVHPLHVCMDRSSLSKC
jgi:hypothetical protein